MKPNKNLILIILKLILNSGPGCHPFLISPNKGGGFNTKGSVEASKPTFLNSRGNGNNNNNNNNNNAEYPDHARSNSNFGGNRRSRLSAAATSTDKILDTSELNKLSVTELMNLLSARGLDFRDCLEKRELVERLQKYYRNNNNNNDKSSSTTSSSSYEAPNSHLSQGEQSRIELFKRVSPCVANIKTTKLVAEQRGLQLRGLEVPTGSGSGFLWDNRGHVVTNFHVVAAGGSRNRYGGMSLPETVKVKLAGMPDALDARIVGVEPEKDLAVVKIEDAKSLRNLPRPIDVGTSNDLQVGQSVVAIGNPFGLDDTLTTGIVSALGRDVDGIGGRPIHGCVQTDAAINPGNSGGPLLDSRGRLIGVNTAIFSPNGAGNVGIGFAIPVDTVRRVVNQLIQYGKVVRPTLGITVVEDRLVRSIENQLGRPLEGCLVADVVEGGPAEKVGITASVMNSYGSIILGDLITSINGEKVRNAEDLISAVEEKNDGDKVELEIWRECDPRRVEKVRVKLITRDALQDRQVTRRRNVSMARPAGRRFMPW